MGFDGTLRLISYMLDPHELASSIQKRLGDLAMEHKAMAYRIELNLSRQRQEVANELPIARFVSTATQKENAKDYRDEGKDERSKK